MMLSSSFIWVSSQIPKNNDIAAGPHVFTLSIMVVSSAYAKSPLGDRENRAGMGMHKQCFGSAVTTELHMTNDVRWSYARKIWRLVGWKISVSSNFDSSLYG